MNSHLQHHHSQEKEGDLSISYRVRDPMKFSGAIAFYISARTSESTDAQNVFSIYLDLPPL